MKDLSYVDAVQWLQERGGSWRSDALTDGPEIVAFIGGVEGRAMANDHSDAQTRAALMNAINQLRYRMR